MSKQLTKEEAIKFNDDKQYESMSHIEIAKFQINQEILCMPFSVFHKAVEKALDRVVFTHEFGFESIKSEINNAKGDV